MSLLAQKIGELVDEAMLTPATPILFRDYIEDELWKIIITYEDTEVPQFIIKVVRRDTL
jgi:hypothetical protein